MNLKDEYHKNFVESLSNDFNKLHADFNQKSFVSSIINKDWENKELKERIRCITENIHKHLTLPYQKQIDVLLEVAPNYTGLQGFLFPDFIELYGLQDVEKSFEAMEVFTELSTAEFAIRPFIEEHPELSMKQMLTWSKSENHHLRRLSSEGCRPRLPWAPPLRKFIHDPSPCLPILNNLNSDESEYVRKSVANHLNDISKDHPELVLKIAKEWYGKSNHTNWIVKHALRTLLKKGNKKALSIFGLDNSEKLIINDLSLTKSEVKIGDYIYFHFDIINQSKQNRNVRLEYKIDYTKANGSTSPKVFQISEFVLKPGTTKQFKRKQSFKQLSTRVHYPGLHKITVIINGDEKADTSVKLI